MHSFGETLTFRNFHYLFFLTLSNLVPRDSEKMRLGRGWTLSWRKYISYSIYFVGIETFWPEGFKTFFFSKILLKKINKIYMFYCFLTMNELQNIKNSSIFKGKNVLTTKCFDAPRSKCFDPPVVYTTNTR